MHLPTITLVALLAGLSPSIAPAAASSLVLLEPELEGDIGDIARLDEWRRRLDLVEARIGDGLAAQDVYRIVDKAPARDLVERSRGQAEVHSCGPCVVTLAKRLDADRALSVWVFRMSNLVLGLHAVLRNGKTGEILYGRTLSFRGDNDRAWMRAVDYLVRDIAAIPPDRR